MTRLRDIMTTDVLTVSPDLSIRETAEVFATHAIGGAPVIAHGEVIGIITARDILDFASALSDEPRESADETSNALERHLVEEAMTHAPLRSLGPDATAEQAAALMRDAHIHRVPVMEGEALLGMVTSLDIAQAIADGRVARRTFVFPKRTRTT